MVGKAMLLTPFWVAAGAVMEVTFLRTHNTGVALRQARKTGVAVALTEAFLGATPTMDTVNISQEL